jgi:hypothetical protein
MRAHEHPWSSDRDGHLADGVLQLAIARELARIGADVLPPELLRLIERLESRASSQDG